MGLPFVRPGVGDLQNPSWWDRFFRDVRIAPDNESVSTEKIQDEAVTNAKLRDSGPHSVIGRASATPGAPADISASAERHFLVRRPAGVQFAAIEDADIPSTIARDTEVTAAQSAAEGTAASALAAHVAAPDPHPGYLTPAEGNAAYDAIGAAAAVLAYLPTVGGDYADDTAAAAGGIAIGRLYHTAGAVKIRRT